jgi:hypothetical protein
MLEIVSQAFQPQSKKGAREREMREVKAAEAKWQRHRL